MFNETSVEIYALYEKRELGQAMRKIMLLADKANQYLDHKKPWIMIKDENHKEEVHQICTTAINVFLKLTIMLKPVMPDVAKNVESFMNLTELKWSDINNTQIDYKINTYENLLTRIREESIERIIKK